MKPSSQSSDRIVETTQTTGTGSLCSSSSSSNNSTGSSTVYGDSHVNIGNPDNQELVNETDSDNSESENNESAVESSTVCIIYHKISKVNFLLTDIFRKKEDCLHMFKSAVKFIRTNSYGWLIKMIIIFVNIVRKL